MKKFILFAYFVIVLGGSYATETFIVHAGYSTVPYTINCDKRGSSGTCFFYLGPQGDFQLYKLDYNMHVEGHGGGADSSLNFCMSPDRSFSGTCAIPVQKQLQAPPVCNYTSPPYNRPGQIDDSRCTYNGSIENLDPSRPHKQANLDVWGNDASWIGTVTLNYRRVWIYHLTCNNGPADCNPTVGQSYQMGWDSDVATQGEWLKWTGPLGSGSIPVPERGSQVFNCNMVGTYTYTLSALGPSANGVVERTMVTPVTCSAGVPPPTTTTPPPTTTTPPPTTTTPPPPPPSAPPNDASCVSIVAPDRVTPGQSFSATVTFKNTGTNTWDSLPTDKPHQLAPDNPLNNTLWGMWRDNLDSEPVPTGQNGSFTFTGRATTTPGVYNFDWRMVETGVAYFPPASKCAKTIEVTGAPTPMACRLNNIPGFRTVYNLNPSSEYLSTTVPSHLWQTATNRNISARNYRLILDGNDSGHPETPNELNERFNVRFRPFGQPTTQLAQSPNSDEIVNSTTNTPLSYVGGIFTLPAGIGNYYAHHANPGSTESSNDLVAACFALDYLTQCNDMVDNDGDGFIDFGTGPNNDPDCTSYSDNNESRGIFSVDIKGWDYSLSRYVDAPVAQDISELAKIKWTSVNADSCGTSFVIGDAESGTYQSPELRDGELNYRQTASRVVYTVTCVQGALSRTNSVVIKLIPAPAVVLTFTASPPTVNSSEVTHLAWSATNADSCTASGGWSGSRSVSGTEDSSPLTTRTTFTITCNNRSSTRSKSVVVNVRPAPPVTQCNDGIDNDGDGKIDFGTGPNNDPGCSSPSDNNELDAVLSVQIVRDVGGDGRVASAPVGIACEPTCSHTYIRNESVTLRATPVTGSKFWRWEGDCSGTISSCVVGMSVSHNVAARFGKNNKFPIFVTVVKEGGGNGKVTSDKGAISCEPICSDIYDINTVVILTARPSPGSRLWAWEGACTGTALTCSVTASRVLEVTARFGVGSPPANCPTDGPSKCPQCNDGVNNDSFEDTLTDMDDPGCTSLLDNSELDRAANCPADGPGICPQCNDGVDNDKDGKGDWAGLDLDGDGIKEVPPDPSCQGQPNRNTEAGGLDIIEI